MEIVRADRTPGNDPARPSRLLLHSKFVRPALREQRVVRPRLLALLRTDPAPPLTLIAAPAGYGKTTLIGDWVATDARQAAWLRLDPDDDELITFWTTVATALAMVHPPVSTRALGLLRQFPSPAVAAVLGVLLTDLATQLPLDTAAPPLLLVVEDYHVITQPTIHESVNTLIQYLPPPVRLVLTSRADPPLSLGRLRVRGHLLEIRAADLAFVVSETATFLTETMGLPLPGAAPTLTARTEGWAAALQLAALALRHQPDASAFLARFSGQHEHLLGYLAEEVFSQQPVARQTFLWATCVLERMCAALCAAVLADPAAGRPPDNAATAQAQQMLEELEAANLFVVALDSDRRWYRYHPLFAEAVRHQLRRAQPGDEGVYRQRAAAWLTQAGYAVEAIRQALAGQDWATAADLIGQHADAAWCRGELRRLSDWLDALPAELLRRHPRLGLLRALQLLQDHQYAATQTWLTAIAQELDPAEDDATGSDPAARAGLRGRAAIIQAQVNRALQQDLDQSTVLVRQALATLPADEGTWRMLALTNLGTIAYTTDDLEGARAHYAAAATVATQGRFHLINLMARSRMAATLHDLGRLHEALAACADARDRLAASGLADFPGLCEIDWAEALIRYEWNDLAGAAALLARAVTEAARNQQPELQGFAEITRSRVYQAQGHPQAALQALEAAQALLAPPGSGAQIFETLLAPWRAQALADPALATAHAAGDPTDERPIPFLAHWLTRAWHLRPARRQLEAGDPAAAHRGLEALAARAEAVGARTFLIAVRALDALALATGGQRAAAHARLREAIRLGAPDSHIRAILDAGPAIQPLLADVAAAWPTAAPELQTYLNRLGAAAGAAAIPAAAIPPQRPGPPIPLLTEREQAILRLLAAGCSNQEIAAQLILGVSTVKWYLRTIYDKLNSANRTQAVARARALGLIPLDWLT